MDKEQLEYMVKATGIGAVTILIGPAIGTISGAVGGEVLDHIPYLKHAIPQGIAYLGNALSSQDTVRDAMKYLEGNLDKIGAFIGFLGGYRINNSLRVKKD